MFILAGCGSTRIKDPILLERPAAVKVRYEFDDVVINIPVTVEDTTVTGIRLSVGHRNSPGTELLTRTVRLGEPLQLLVPRNILSPDSLSNLVRVEPLGTGFESVVRMFSVSEQPVVTIPNVVIRKIPYIISGVVLERAAEQPVSAAQVELVAKNKNLIFGRTYSDSTGFYRFEIIDRDGLANDYYLSVSTNGKFPVPKIDVQFSEEKSFTCDILLGLSSGSVGGGTVYRVINDKIPFRAGPDNASDIQFFLNIDDLVVITRVAGNRYYGFVELPVLKCNQIQKVYGWVQSDDLELEQ